VLSSHSSFAHQDPDSSAELAGEKRLSPPTRLSDNVVGVRNADGKYKVAF
jgi:hypothetical protein